MDLKERVEKLEELLTPRVDLIETKLRSLETVIKQEEKKRIENINNYLESIGHVVLSRVCETLTGDFLGTITDIKHCRLAGHRDGVVFCELNGPGECVDFEDVKRALYKLGIQSFHEFVNGSESVKAKEYFKHL